ncbi:putative RNA binding protein [Tripterygium wilfordii]|uniref:Putative RNA binding protein n=1 Tax=Tripterygium wilfordii TaxID=458696 RepID=A0A7J7DYD2_TRIWF|nr:mini-ribonuclease 3 [Tripterygium wilfordii]KAF5751279.1 putative RNA binding protein [Tripterygium wilfordii]
MFCSSVRVVASWDTQQRLTYNPNAPRNPKKDPIPSRSVNPNSVTPSPTVTLTAGTNQSIFDLLKRPSQVVAVKLDEDQSYMGYERWLPSPPKVEKPRSVYNATSLAYIGDCIYELYARRHFLFPPLHIEEYNERVMAVVRCEAQDVFLQKLLDDDYLSREERDVLRWGKNIISSKTKTKRRAGGAVYNRASSLETLVGYLYLTNANRLDEVMLKLGFCTDSSSQMILEKQVVGKQDSQ